MRNTEGCSLLDQIANDLMPLFSQAQKAEVADKLVEIFSDFGCDLYRSENDDIVAAYNRANPDEQEESEDEEEDEN